MKVNGVDFNIQYVAGLEMNEFTANPAFAHLWPELKSAEERTLRMEQVWQMCKSESAKGSIFEHATEAILAEPFTQEQANRNWEKIEEKLKEEEPDHAQAAHINEMVCPHCKELTTVADVMIEKAENKIGEHYGIVYFDCQHCSKEIKKTQWGHFDDVEEGIALLLDTDEPFSTE